MKTARFISQQLGGAEVTIFHGASHGLLGDGGRAFCELHLPGTTHRMGCFSDYLISTNAQLAKENPKNYSHAIFGFSEGGIVIRNSLENVYSLDHHEHFPYIRTPRSGRRVAKTAAKYCYRLHTQRKNCGEFDWYTQTTSKVGQETG